MKTRMMIAMIALVFACSPAYAVMYADTGGVIVQAGGNMADDLHGDNDYFQQSGMTMNAGGLPASDPIMEDSYVSGRCIDSPYDDLDSFNFEVGLPFTLTMTDHHDLLGISNGAAWGSGDVFYTYNAGLAAHSWAPTETVNLPAGWYNFRVMQINSGGNYGIDPWTWSLTIDVQEATNPVAEPAGLGLVGMALLGLRKRRS